MAEFKKWYNIFLQATRTAVFLSYFVAERLIRRFNFPDVRAPEKLVMFKI
jgi:hypothetical protein